MLTDEELEKLQNEINEQIELIKREEKEYNLMVENSKKQNNISEIAANFENLYNGMDTDEKIEFLKIIIKTIKTEVKIKKVNVVNRSEIDITDIIFN